MLFHLSASLEAATGFPEPAGYIFAVLFGLAIGSFLNVVIHRVPRGQSVVAPGSACPGCGAAINAYDNIPVLSWLILRGRCRSCGAAISARYPAVELAHALLWVLVYWQIGFSAFLPVALIFVSVMMALIFIDAEHMILPNVITYPLLVLAFIVRLVYPLFISAEYFSDIRYWPLTQLVQLPVWAVSLAGALLGALVGGGFLWLVGEIWKRLRGVEAMGLGDVKMMAAVGALLGWRLTLLSVFIAAFAGAAIGIVVVLRQREKDFQAQIPFGIFLGLGSIISLLFGERLISWYVSTFIP